MSENVVHLEPQVAATVAPAGTANIVVDAADGFLKASVNAGAYTRLATVAPAGGGTGTLTAFTTGSVVFAGASGVYSQDNAGFFYDPTNHRLGIGTTAPPSPLTVSQNAAALQAVSAGTILQVSAADGANTNVFIDSYAGIPQLIFRRAQGTAASPSAVQSGNVLARFGALSFGQTVYSPGYRARMDYAAAENWSDTAQGTYIIFVTTPKTTVTPIERVRIDDAGSVGIGCTPGYRLDVQAPGSACLLNISASSVGTGDVIAQIANTGGLTFWGNESSGGGTVTGGLAYASIFGSYTDTAVQLFQHNIAYVTLISGGNVGIATSAPATLLSIGGDANGGQAGIHVATELLTVANAATSDTVANMLPIGAIVLCVTCRVTVAIPTATTFTLKGASDGVTYTGSISVALGTTSVGTTHWGSTGTQVVAATQKIRCTPNSTPANSNGRVRITVYYFLPTPPTS